MAKAGYSCLIRRSGTPTATTAEACTNVSGNVYQITSSARRCVDPRTPWHLEDSGGTVPYANITDADFLFGEFTVTGVAGSLEFNGDFIPLTTASEVIQEAKSFSLSESAEVLDTTVFTGGTSRIKRKIPGLVDATLSVEGLWTDADHAALIDLHEGGTPFVFEVNSGASQLFRAFALIEDYSRNASVDGLVERSVSMVLDTQRDDNTGFFAGKSDRLL